jgi:hypothetical protein
MLMLNELLLTQNNIDTQTCLEFITSAKATEMCFKSRVQQLLLHDKILEFLATIIYLSLKSSIGSRTQLLSRI